ncbi:hypothetical protein M231_06020 [Tremella mesenterica]|uniref:Non-haem dioxygenase N-terminal domain-containing protein n=1 Tax=Tremella mesenterica TaxID=5217 RepID=A0A4Q1BGL8_TREME|nr:hypothetical protein M231_06020 [Tremella mesenterica]
MSSPVSPVVISFPTLLSDPDGLRKDIEKAFGHDLGCLGVILISDLPEEYNHLRENLFRLGERFATLPERNREKYARPETSYMFGWSHGKEVMNGKPDLLKGSFYANPLTDLPDVPSSLRASYPELGKIIYEVGLSLAKACETFVSSSIEGSEGVGDLLKGSNCHKARLLHYYPQSSSQITQDELCGTHLDHSLLTGLCSAIYLDSSISPPNIIDPPSTEAGLWIYPRGESSDKGKPVKVDIPFDCLGFQIGEALEILTEGKLAATPHYVSGTMGESSNTISRETFAFFLQPDIDDFISPSETFGQFTKRVLERHYTLTPQTED